MAIACRYRGRVAAGFLAALAGLFVALSLAGACADVARADAAQVTVVSPGGAQRTLALEALAGSEDVRDRTYVLRSSAGETQQIVNGFSLAVVLEAAGADPYGFSYLEAQRPAGGAVLLSRHQALDADAFAEGPPVVYATAVGTGFLRPSSGPEDLNASDFFEAPQGVTLVLHKDKPLQVRAKASTKRTEPGKKVTFTAIVERAGAGEELAYSWYFDDGNSGSGPSATHSFAKRGSYDVVVGVTTPGDDVGTSAVVTVQVGEPLGGPDRKGGGTNRNADAPDHGAATGSQDGGSPGSSSIPVAPVYTAPAPTPSPAAAAPTAPPAKTAKPAPETAAGEQVSGQLLTETTNAAPADATKTPAARTGNLSGDGGNGGGLPAAALGLLAAASLLGAGALIEARGLRDLLPSLRGGI